MCHHKACCICSQYYFALLCSCHHSSYSNMLHIFSLEYNPLLCGFVEAGFCKCNLFFNWVIKEHNHLSGLNELIKKLKLLAAFRTEFILFLVNSLLFFSMPNSLVCIIINYAHRQMNWNKITSLQCNRLVLLCAYSGLSSCWCILRKGKKFMTVLLKRLMEVRCIFLPSGRFLGTKNTTGKCTVFYSGHLK